MKRVLTPRSTDQRPIRGGRLAPHPRRYRVRILGDPPADLGGRISQLHASAIQGRDDTVRSVRRTSRPDGEASAAVRRTGVPDESSDGFSEGGTHDEQTL